MRRLLLCTLALLPLLAQQKKEREQYYERGRYDAQYDRRYDDRRYDDRQYDDRGYYDRGW